MALKAAPAAKASGKLSPKAKAKPRAAAPAVRKPKIAPAGATRRDRAHQPPGAATARSAMIPRPAPDREPSRAIHVSGYDRKGQDFYATPAWVTESLLSHVRFRGPIWEPCCGDGAMSSVLAAHRYKVVSTDIADRGFGTPGVDFLTCRKMPKGCRSLVTNPPYGDSGSDKGQTRSSSLAMLDFLRHALVLTASVQGQLALLVRLQWLAGRRAADVLSAGPFAATVILTQRIRWFDRGPATKRAQHHHAWVVFDYARPAGSPPTLLYV